MYRLDNDMYHHMNNNVYGLLYANQHHWIEEACLDRHRFDSIVNQYLIEYCGRNPQTSEEIGLLVNSYCNFFGSVAYPGVVDCGMRVNKIGKTSVEYEIGVFEKGQDEVRAVGGFTHVFCDREKNRPQSQGMAPDIRSGLERVLAREASKL